MVVAAAVVIVVRRAHLPFENKKGECTGCAMGCECWQLLSVIAANVQVPAVRGGASQLCDESFPWSGGHMDHL
jgi:hypothetical protein